MTESMGEKPKTALEITEQVLRDAGFRYATSHGSWVYGELSGENYIEVTLSSSSAVVWCKLKHLPLMITAPALVQRLTDALKPFEYDNLNIDGSDIDPPHRDHHNMMCPVTAGAIRGVRAALTAAEQANLPRMYSMEEIDKAVCATLNPATNLFLGEDSATLLRRGILRRLRGPQKGGEAG